MSKKMEIVEGVYRNEKFTAEQLSVTAQWMVAVEKFREIIHACENWNVTAEEDYEYLRRTVSERQSAVLMLESKMVRMINDNRRRLAARKLVKHLALAVKECNLEVF